MREWAKESKDRKEQVSQAKDKIEARKRNLSLS
jgi:hypothetical protein